MGNPLYSDDTGKMCWNAAKTWQVGWYSSNTYTFDESQGSWSGDLVGVADFGNDNIGDKPVVIKIETGTTTDQFIAFNRAIGFNSDNDEADNEVTIVETGADGEGYSQSYLKAHLVQGESYAFTNWAGSGQDLVVTAETINILTNPGYAHVTICLGTCGTSHPTASPTTNAPSKVPTNIPTATPTTAAPTKIPTTAPTTNPTTTQAPSDTPTKRTTKGPTTSPSNAPTQIPTSVPTISPTIFDPCGEITRGKICNNTSNCAWSGGVCSSTGPPPTTPPPAPSPPTTPAPSLAPGACSATACSYCDAKGDCTNAGCSWKKGKCV